MTSTLTYEDALAYLAQFINYETRQRVAYDHTHFNVQAFADFLTTLGSPHQAFPSILIAGSKGKGSTAAIVASILSQAGLRTGLFTKPHLVTIRERTQIDRQLISRDAFSDLVAELQTHVDTSASAHPRRFRTFFELTTALSFLYFARHRVDIAVVEVGLGGRLDTTNVLMPEVAVITPIGLEHTHILGNTLAAIAQEKAGIIKPHSTVVSAPQAPEVVDVLIRRCQEQQATLWLAGRDVTWEVADNTVEGLHLSVEGCGERWSDLKLALLGRHQAMNAAVAMTVVQQLRQRGWPITETHLRQGLANVHWEGRLEIVARAPWVVFDAAHTVESAQCLNQALTELFPTQRRLLVIGMSTDKRVADVIAMLVPAADGVIVTRFNNPRACDPQQLADEVRRHGIAVQLAPDPATALTTARAQARPDDLICVTGSLLLLGELKARLQGLALEF